MWLYHITCYTMTYYTILPYIIRLLLLLLLRGGDEVCTGTRHRPSRRTSCTRRPPIREQLRRCVPCLRSPWGDFLLGWNYMTSTQYLKTTNIVYVKGFHLKRSFMYASASYSARKGTKLGQHLWSHCKQFVFVWQRDLLGTPTILMIHIILMIIITAMIILKLMITMIILIVPHLGRRSKLQGQPLV